VKQSYDLGIELFAKCRPVKAAGIFAESGAAVAMALLHEGRKS
jgi:hypothetical protein